MTSWSDVQLTGRVVRLRLVKRGDESALLEAANGDRSSYAFTWVPATMAEAIDHVAAQIDEFESLRAVPFVVEDVVTDRIVGQTRFLDLEFFEDRFVPQLTPRDPRKPPRAVEIGGTWYSASVQRSAVNTECKLLMLAHAFEVWDVERVSLKTDARNERSRRAIERIGARFEGIRRAHMRAPDATIRDSAYYSIIAAEWPTVRTALESLLRR